MTDRRRNLFILLVVAGILIGSAFVIATKSTKLGLDLRGGVELVYEARPTPQQPVVDASALDRSIDVMRERVDRLGVAEPEIQRSGNNQISVGLPDVANADDAIRQVGRVAQLQFYDWEPNVIGPNGKPSPNDPNVTGGPQAGQIGALTQYEAVERASKRPAIDDGNNSHDGVFYAVDDKDKKVLAGPQEQRDDLQDELEANTKPKGKEDPKVTAAQAARAKTVEVKPGTVVVRAEQDDDASDEQKTDQYFVLADNIALAGTEVKDPEQNFDSGPGGSGQPIVTFKFTDSGRKKWEQVTKEIAQRGQRSQLPGSSAQEAAQHFAIVLDDELISTPFIDFVQNPNGIDASNGSQIEGGFTIQSAQDLSNLLKTGALPVKLELISQSQVSATLGQEALDQGLVAGIVGFSIVALFLLIFYRILGLIAVLALTVYAVYFFALIKLIPITMTLPGIAGLILTIGVAADANIVIFERVKEEIRGGRSVMAGLATGYKKGLTAIIDANVVTIMVAFILFVLATAGVKGFALTLGLGVIVSLFTAVLATQAILGAMGKSRLLSSPSALGASKPKGNRLRLNYVGYSRWFFSLSGLILLVCALALGSKGINFGIDFESGTRINVALRQDVDENALRDVLASVGQKDAEIQKVIADGKGASKFQISTSTLRPAQVTRVQAAIDRKYDFADTPSSTSIGPTFGQTVANSAIVAIIASLLVISAYIALRFEPKYAVPVLIAVMHDILITAGIYALVGQEVSTATVAALLTILGFSLYDTIIVFDRIRENVPRMPRAAFSQIVNRSMSEVIVRSLATSFCSGLPVLALLLFGGETLQAFAFALLVGTISGTYSSVFIAAPVLTAWKEREPIYRRRHASIAAENGGVVPAFATGAAGVQVEGPTSRRLRGGTRLTAPDDPEGKVSRTEFDDMVRDLHVDPAPRRTAVAEPPAPRPKPEPRDDAADALPEDVVMPDRPDPRTKPKPGSGASRRKGKHGRPR
ncbi:MAG TPA: protein translocase subunit SecD [Solirubrobacteraceae bacterium]